MFATQEQIEKMAKQNVEAALAAANAQLGAFEKLASLNLELTKAGFTTAVDYWRGVYGLPSQGNGSNSAFTGTKKTP